MHFVPALAAKECLGHITSPGSKVDDRPKAEQLLIALFQGRTVSEGSGLRGNENLDVTQKVYVTGPKGTEKMQVAAKDLLHLTQSASFVGHQYDAETPDKKAPLLYAPLILSENHIVYLSKGGNRVDFCQKGKVGLPIIQERGYDYSLRAIEVNEDGSVSLFTTYTDLIKFEYSYKNTSTFDNVLECFQKRAWTDPVKEQKAAEEKKAAEEQKAAETKEKEEVAKKIKELEEKMEELRPQLEALQKEKKELEEKSTTVPETLTQSMISLGDTLKKLEGETKDLESKEKVTGAQSL